MTGAAAEIESTRELLPARNCTEPL